MVKVNEEFMNDVVIKGLNSARQGYYNAINGLCHKIISIIKNVLSSVGDEVEFVDMVHDYEHGCAYIGVKRNENGYYFINKDGGGTSIYDVDIRLLMRLGDAFSVSLWGYIVDESNND